ncbi:hypothetical protein [Sulfodiicoccus acidiphilus]|uniref:hypothetical protein n=1 Tax=Sulfodiicoccus acidiphilus TaxID=1670455 RepID=UPI00131562D8|nr:hypothetical protein [Sulfodiicoccus acidiphilus]
MPSAMGSLPMTDSDSIPPTLAGYPAVKGGASRFSRSCGSTEGHFGPDADIVVAYES